MKPIIDRQTKGAALAFAALAAYARAEHKPFPERLSQMPTAPVSASIAFFGLLTDLRHLADFAQLDFDRFNEEAAGFYADDLTTDEDLAGDDVCDICGVSGMEISHTLPDGRTACGPCGEYYYNRQDAIAAGKLASLQLRRAFAAQAEKEAHP
jgi:hypothetical protein